MTYKEAYDKIIEAYFKDEINPMDASFCFCGTLCDGDIGWHGCTHGRVHNDFMFYRGVEYVRMERALLDTIREFHGYYIKSDNPGYEDALFEGMSAALDVLKQIHIERGEIVDELPSLTKRGLCTEK